jgi:putative spermidine/putrescine transport system permease protein
VTLSWNEYDRTALVLAGDQATLPVQIFAFTVSSVIRPDLYALGTATTLVTLLAVGIFLTVATLYLRRRRLVLEAPPEEPEETDELTAPLAGTTAGG